jgi:hypothetical protein
MKDEGRQNNFKFVAMPPYFSSHPSTWHRLLMSHLLFLLAAWSLYHWNGASFSAPRMGLRRATALFVAPEDDPNDLMEKAKSLRQEVESFESQRKAAEDDLRREQQAEQTAVQDRRERYSAMVPILKGDGSTQEERCDFTPRWDEETSYILVLEANLPIGVIMGESEDFAATTVVDEVAEGSNGELAGLQVGDLVRAFTACRIEMEMPTWQLLAGGIGRPKTKRFMYQADGRPFEEVMEAVASNRQDPEERPVLLVIERKYGEELR